jgi:hypothetical protein
MSVKSAEDKMRPEVTPFFDEPTNTFSYVVTDLATKQCPIIDSVLDYDPASGRTDRCSAKGHRLRA